MNQQNSLQPEVKPGIESWNCVVETKRSWRQLPRSMIVMEFYGTGDPFFGGSAHDLILDRSDRLVDEWKIKPDEKAVFRTIEEAHEAAKRIKVRRPGSVLGVIPTWEGSVKPLSERYPRLLAALVKNCLLTPSEALCALEGREPEAVRHLGGWQKAIQAALQARHL